MTAEHWQDGNARCFGMLLDGRAQPTGIRRRGTDATLLLVLNAHHDVVKFTLPAVPGGKRWMCLIDTNQPELGAAQFPIRPRIRRHGHSLLLFMTRPDENESGSEDAQRSYQFVVSAFHRAIDEDLVLPDNGS